MYRVYAAETVSRGSLNKILETKNFRKAARIAAKLNKYWIIQQSRDWEVCSVNDYQRYKNCPTQLQLVERFKKEMKGRKVHYRD